jgi:hypothetical protein
MKLRKERSPKWNEIVKKVPYSNMHNSLPYNSITTTITVNRPNPQLIFGDEVLITALSRARCSRATRRACLQYAAFITNADSLGLCFLGVIGLDLRRNTTCVSAALRVSLGGLTRLSSTGQCFANAWRVAANGAFSWWRTRNEPLQSLR